METFSALLALCAGNSPVTSEFPAQRPVTQSFDVSLICARINGWVNNHKAGDLKRHRANYDVIVMWEPRGDPSTAVQIKNSTSWLNFKVTVQICRNISASWYDKLLLNVKCCYFQTLTR